MTLLRRRSDYSYLRYTKKKFCEVCGNEFDSLSRNSRLCSPECKAAEKAALAREWRKLLKFEFLEIYGTHCQCPCGCQVSEPGYLGIGHINGDGKDHRAIAGGAGHKTLSDLKRHGWPRDQVRIECWNCNFGRRILGTGKCPRETSEERVSELDSINYISLDLEGYQ